MVILDLRMAGMSGVETMELLKERTPHQQFIICTGHACLESAVASVNMGAFRYLIKPFGREELREVIREALAEYRRRVRLRESQSVSPMAISSLGLSPREAEVAFEIVRDKENPEIASDLKISVRTVEKHIQKIFSHLRISKRGDLKRKFANCFILPSGLAHLSDLPWG